MLYVSLHSMNSDDLTITTQFSSGSPHGLACSSQLSRTHKLIEFEFIDTVCAISMAAHDTQRKMKRTTVNVRDNQRKMESGTRKWKIKAKQSCGLATVLF